MAETEHLAARSNGGGKVQFNSRNGNRIIAFAVIRITNSVIFPMT
jgi:hypothetical protein